MAENKTSCIVYCDWIYIFEGLEDDEAGRLIKHFFRYVNDYNPEPPDKVTKVAFESIKQTLKRDLVKYEKKRGNLSKSGHLGGIASGKARSKVKQSEANEANASKAKQHEANASNMKQNEADEAVSVSVPVSVSEEQSSFERFWKVYPKKKSKGSAERVWLKINPKNGLVEKIISKVEILKNSKDWKKDGGQFIPYPATWLNAKGWEDEVEGAINGQETMQQRLARLKAEDTGR